MSALVRAPGWSWLALAIVVLLLGALSGELLRRKLAEDLALARQQAEQRSRLVTSMLSSALQAGRYQNIESLLNDLGESDANIVSLEVTAANGFIMGSYQRPGESERGLALESRIPYSYRGEATLSLPTSASIACGPSSTPSPNA